MSIINLVMEKKLYVWNGVVEKANADFEEGHL